MAFKILTQTIIISNNIHSTPHILSLKNKELTTKSEYHIFRILHPHPLEYITNHSPSTTRILSDSLFHYNVDPAYVYTFNRAFTSATQRVYLQFTSYGCNKRRSYIRVMKLTLPRHTQTSQAHQYKAHVHGGRANSKCPKRFSFVEVFVFL